MEDKMGKNKNRILVIVISMILGFAFPYISSAVDNTYQNIKNIIDAFEIIKENYVEDIDSQKLIYGAIKGMVSELDDFSQFMEPDVYERVKSDTEGEFGGIGIKLDIQDNWPTVVTPLPGTPAFNAGIYPGDKIIKIEDESTKDMLIDMVVKKLRGKPGTKVKITIAREPKDKDSDWITRDIELVRDLIKNEVIKSKVLDNNIGYIKIIDFSGHVFEELKKALDNLKQQNIQGLVIDLRYNPGGILTSAVDIARLFLDSNKMIVYTKGRKSDSYQEFRANFDAPYSDLPIVVLVNRYSASASEILAGALKDNKRAVIIGETTFGKASVQTMIPLSDKSALRLTIAHYYTPSGKMIHRDPKTGKGGINPDIEVKISKEDEIKLLKQQEEIYYPKTKEEKVEGKLDLNEELEDLKKDKNKKQQENVKDEVLNRAVEILKAREVLSNLVKK